MATLAQSRANDSNDWRRRGEPEASTSAAWSRPVPAKPAQTRISGYQQRRIPQKRQADSESEAADDIDYSKRIYLGNLLYFATENDIKTLLEGYEYAGIVISIDPFTARNPSYCFVDFVTEEEAQRALAELDGKLLLKREVKTRPATKPGQVAKKYQPTKFRPSRPEWVDPSSTTAPGETPWVFDRWKKDGMDVLQHNFPAQGCRLFVGNLPGFNLHPPTVQTNIKALFASQGFEPLAISKIIPSAPEHKQPDGCDNYVFVDLVDDRIGRDAVNALNNAIPPWGGRSVKVSFSSGTPSWKVHQRQDYMQQHGLETPLDQGGQAQLANDNRPTSIGVRPDIQSYRSVAL